MGIILNDCDIYDDGYSLALNISLVQKWILQETSAKNIDTCNFGNEGSQNQS